jgi:transcriptional regulator with XRE-family HTH domain
VLFWVKSMTTFGIKLKELMAEAALKQQALARGAGIAQGVVARYLAGEGLPEGPTLLAICGVFSKSRSTDLMWAWVEDRLGRPAAQAMRKAKPPVNDSADWLQQLPKDFRETLRLFAQVGSDRPEAQETFRQLADLLEGIKK